MSIISWMKINITPLFAFILCIIGQVTLAIAAGLTGITSLYYADPIIILAITFAFMFTIKHTSIGKLFSRRISPVDALFVAIIIASCFLEHELYVLVQRFVGKSNPSCLSPVTGSFILSVINLTFLKPISEELFFRGYVLSAYSKRSAIASVIIVSIMFQLFHVTGIHILFSVACCITIIKGRNILIPIIGHAAFNSYALLVAL